jgi:hypothetical protein
MVCCFTIAEQEERKPMPALQLRTVTRTQGNNAALKDGTVAPRGLVFDFQEVPVLVAPLIPDAREAGPAALRRDGYYPINHLVVVKDELLEEHPAPGRGRLRRRSSTGVPVSSPSSPRGRTT